MKIPRKTTFSTGFPPGISCEITIAVRFSETDQMGVVYHANYLVWFDLAREALLKRMGLNLTAVLRQGISMPVVSVCCKYKHPARYGDTLRVRAVSEGCTAARFRVHFEIVRLDSPVLIATGKSTSVIVGKTGQLLLKLTEQLFTIGKAPGPKQPFIKRI